MNEAEKKTVEFLESLEKDYGFSESSEKWSMSGCEIAEYIGQNITGIFFTKSEAEGTSDWSTEIAEVHILDLSDYDPKSISYLCRYYRVQLNHPENTDHKIEEVRIIPDGYSLMTPESTNMVKFIPHSKHVKMIEQSLFYQRLARIYEKAKSIPFDQLQSLARSSNKLAGLEYLMNIAVVIKTINNEILHTRLKDINITHVIKDSYKISIKTSDDKKFTLSVNKSDEEYALKHQNIHIGNLKLIDMMTCTL